jgi:hypothetical protein
LVVEKGGDWFASVDDLLRDMPLVDSACGLTELAEIVCIPEWNINCFYKGLMLLGV